MKDRVSSEPRVSVVVCTRNRPAMLDRTLTGVARCNFRILETIVIDNASDALNIREIVQKHDALYGLEPRIGVSIARNTGLRSATSEIIACIDDDAYPDRDWLTKLLPEFDDPTVAAVVGRTLTGEAADPDVTLQARMADLDGGPHRRVVGPDTPNWFEITNFGGLGAGANMAFRRSAIDSWGGFDERIGYGTAMPGLEEHNAFFRIVRAGHHIVYTPDAVVYHPITHDPGEARRRLVTRIRSSAAYALLLFTEYPEHRSTLLRYAVDGLRRRPRMWRNTGVAAERLSLWQLATAALYAPLLYLRARRRRPTTSS